MSALEGLKIQSEDGADRMTMRATQTNLNPQRKNLCRRLLHAARHRRQTQIRYTLIMQAQLCTLL